MEPKLYVGNLPFSTTESDLQMLFSQAGNVASIRMITDGHTGQPKGFAFITMGSLGEAQKAITMFNAFSLSDRSLKVSMAKPREERNGKGGFRPPARRHRRRGGSRRY